MSIEQTNQLILLILNSVLMTLLSSILLGGAWLRQNALLQQLHKTRSHYRKLTRKLTPSSSLTSISGPSIQPSIQANTGTYGATHATELHTTAELKQVRDRRQQLTQQYQWSRVGMLLLHTALLIFSVSLFALALRSLLAFDSLISTALFLFAVGAAGLLTGTACILIDFAKGNTSDDSLGQALAKVIQQLSRQWKRSSSRLAAMRLDSVPAVRPARLADKNRPATVKSVGTAGKAPSQQISS